MAVLRSENLSFVLNYVKYDRIMVTYHFQLLCGDEPVLNEGILPSREDYYLDRPIGGGITQDDCGSYVLKFLRKVLETDEPDCWEPVDPDFIITVYPGDYYLFYPLEGYRDSYREELRKEAESRKKRLESGGKTPDDDYSVFILIRAANFKHADAYSCLGLSLNMHVRRCELEKFADDLEVEYNDVMRKCDADMRD